jgi:hypothetical protein
VRLVGFDSLRVDIASDSLRVDIASAADLPRRGGNTRFRAARILLSHAGHSQEWRDECDGKDVFDSHDFPPAFVRKYHWQVTGLLHRSSSKRREPASFLGFDEIVLPAAQARAASPSKEKTAFKSAL